MGTELKPKEINQIVQSCVKAGVTRFKYNGLELEFGEVPAMTRRISHPSNAKLGKMNQIADQSNLDEALRNEEDEADLLLLENPALYEEKLAAGEFDGTGKSNEEAV